MSYKLSSSYRSRITAVVVDMLSGLADEIVSAIEDELEDALAEAYNEGHNEGRAEAEDAAD